jgi:hypothetical protein
MGAETALRTLVKPARNGSAPDHGLILTQKGEGVNEGKGIPGKSASILAILGKTTYKGL